MRLRYFRFIIIGGYFLTTRGFQDEIETWGFPGQNTVESAKKWYFSTPKTVSWPPRTPRRDALPTTQDFGPKSTIPLKITPSNLQFTGKILSELEIISFFQT